MKLWKAITLIGHDRGRVLSDPVIKEKWAWLQDHLRNYSEIVGKQQREILDFEIPYELTLALWVHSPYRFIYENGYLNRPVHLKSGEGISALDALEHFGGEAVFQACDGGLYECDILR